MAVAVLWGREKMVRLLLERGAEVGVKNRDGACVLVVACRARCHLDIIRLLLQHCDPAALHPSEKEDAIAPLLQACEWGHEAAVALMLESGADMSPPKAARALCRACEHQHLGVARLLLRHCGTMLSAEDTVAVYLAAAKPEPSRRMMEVMEALLEHLMPLEALAAEEAARGMHGVLKIDTAIRYAAAVGNLPVASALIQACSPYGGRRYRLWALVDAVRHGHRPIVEVLLRQPKESPKALDVNATATVKADWTYLSNDEAIRGVRGGRTCTVLHVACAVGDPAVVRLLLDHRADTRALLGRGGDDESTSMTPLLVACKYGRTACVQVLLEHDATLVRDYDANAHGALWHAVEGGHTALVEMLVCRGASSDPMGTMDLPSPIGSQVD